MAQDNFGSRAMHLLRRPLARGKVARDCATRARVSKTTGFRRPPPLPLRLAEGSALCAPPARPVILSTRLRLHRQCRSRSCRCLITVNNRCPASLLHCGSLFRLWRKLGRRVSKCILAAIFVHLTSGAIFTARLSTFAMGFEEPMVARVFRRRS